MTDMELRHKIWALILIALLCAIIATILDLSTIGLAGLAIVGGMCFTDRIAKKIYKIESGE